MVSRKMCYLSIQFGPAVNGWSNFISTLLFAHFRASDIKQIKHLVARCRYINPWRVEGLLHVFKPFLLKRHFLVPPIPSRNVSAELFLAGSRNVGFCCCRDRFAWKR